MLCRFLREHDPQFAFHLDHTQCLQAESAAWPMDAPPIQRLVNRAVGAADEELAVCREEVVVIVQRHGDVPAGVLVGDEVPAHVRREALTPDALVGEDEFARRAGREVGDGTEL